MKKLLLLVFLLPAVMLAQVKVEQPKTKHPTAFAIVTDSETYRNTKSAIEAYRDAVEADGLSAYIVYANWTKPDEVRAELEKLYKNKTPLEGAVFVGDVPVALVRNAQHMTTAFKMNEKAFTIQESSVPSDRFYDDLNLQFEYIQQDSIDPSHHYYKLLESSPQRLNPTFYSARIKYPEDKGENKYEEIAKYLNKVVALKKEQKSNYLDKFVSFTGSGYNSECLVAWLDEEKALRESFPNAWANSESAKFLNYRMADYMKYNLFDELQRSDVDVFMFHEHGLPTQQLISNSKAGSSFEEQYESIRTSLYASARRAINRGQYTLDSIKTIYSKEYGFDASFFDKLYDKDLLEADSIKNADIYISLPDLKGKKTNPRFVMFDACYNGSFHLKDYIAGYYIFNEGSTVVAQGNTRNVLQDRWTIELIGILSHGARVGQYNRLVASLEGHLIGDPTLRFATKEKESLAQDLVLKSAQPSVWEKYLKSDDPVLQALSIRYLAENDKENNFASRFAQIFKTSPYNIVRMEALKVLSNYGGTYFTEVVALAVKDSYELIARLGATYSGRIGEESLLKNMTEAYLASKERARVDYNLGNAFVLFPKEKVENAFSVAVANSPIADKEKKTKTFVDDFSQNGKRLDKSLASVMDKTKKPNARIGDVRLIRNYNYHYNLDSYFKLLADADDDTEVRVVMAEALGWFVNSYRKAEIIDACNSVLAQNNLPLDLKLELEQTINRLK